jgi:hypothetical protein
MGQNTDEKNKKGLQINGADEELWSREKDSQRIIRSGIDQKWNIRSGTLRSCH